MLIGYVPEYEAYTRAEFVDAIEKWLICIEMVVIAVCFHFAYPVEEFTGAAASGKAAAAAGTAGPGTGPTPRAAAESGKAAPGSAREPVAAGAQAYGTFGGGGNKASAVV